MEVIRNITPDIVWVGGSDVRLALFENMFPLDNGVSYNSFLISDEKTAVIDTVDEAVGRRFVENIKASLNGRSLDYLIINHMEPDHCANIDEICRLFPEVKIVGNKKTFQMIEQFYDIDISGRTLEVKDGGSLSLGKHELRFVFTPMVHWPEVMFTYDVHDKVLFSADAFGTFGTYKGNIFSDEADYEELYLKETRRYYANIVGKYGMQVQAAMKKVADMDIQMICPLHGPVLRGDDKDMLLDKYKLWSAYLPEEKGVMIAYASMYGNTENAVQLLSNLLAQSGVKNIRMYDVSKTHFSEIVADSFRFSHLVFASPTYNLKLYGGMEAVIRDLAALNVQNRTFSVIGNGSWSPAAGKIMSGMLAEMKNMTPIGETLEIKSALKKEQYPELEKLALAIADSVSNG
ncbi:FprA family A-type flavoprotein [Kineothrix sp. MB12-C1]|uniref:FprA family A-type flavoprotein n=1 Tax=Kineothrix sp. MB12-C1 TaxID=3070215 RepID=UPI0027D2BF29|nr:FprA family A-type flavoprotein [Kineothrix sp. MB12-C1]WMC91830.1 FprA family A-type flavoprotein [Kineothrix sp. MB12-C1]